MIKAHVRAETLEHAKQDAVRQEDVLGAVRRQKGPGAPARSRVCIRGERLHVVFQGLLTCRGPGPYQRVPRIPTPAWRGAP